MHCAPAQSDKIVNVLNSWNTWGPFKGPSQLFNFTARSRLLYAASVGWVRDSWAAMPQSAGMVAQIFVLDVVIKKPLAVQELALWSLKLAPGGLATTLVYGLSPLDKGTAVVLTQGAPAKPLANSTQHNLTMAPGAWFFFVSSNASATQMFYVQETPVQIRISASGGVSSTAVPSDEVLQPGDTLRFSLLSFGVTLKTNLDTIADALALHEYLLQPPVQDLAPKDWPSGRFQAARNRSKAPLLSYTAGRDDQDLQPVSIAIALPRPAQLPHANTETMIGVLVPLQLCGLNPRWAVGLFQSEGYMEPGRYNGSGTGRYTALGLDHDHCSYAPLYVDRADAINVTMGHPVLIGGGRNQSLWPDVFIEVVKLSDSANPGQSDSWLVTANNPTDAGISCTFIPGFPISPSSPKKPSCSLQRALLTPWVHPGSLYRGGNGT